jgi:hypothetical protein
MQVGARHASMKSHVVAVSHSSKHSTSTQTSSLTILLAAPAMSFQLAYRPSVSRPCAAPTWSECVLEITQTHIHIHTYTLTC